MKNGLLKNIQNNSDKNKLTVYSKVEEKNNINQFSENSFVGDKKITIKDLCPEEKARIGELIKKLAEEKEEKENLRIKLENEKKDYESRIESIVKENNSVIVIILKRYLKAQNFFKIQKERLIMI